MKIAYIVIDENLDDMLLRRQVVELLGEIRKLNPSITIRLFLFKNLISAIFNIRHIFAARVLLRQEGVLFTFIPMLSPWPLGTLKITRTDMGWRPSVVWTMRAEFFLRYTILPILYIIHRFGRYRIFHCRSYLATSAAVALKDLVRSARVVFDPRSDFPEESVTAGQFSQDSKDFIFWKRREAYMLKHSDYVACISELYVHHYRHSASKFRYRITPNNVRTVEFAHSEGKRLRARLALNIPNESIVYIYLGGLTSGGWHQADFYLKFFEEFCRNRKDAYLVMIIPSAATSLIPVTYKSVSNIRIVSPPYNMTPDFLSAGDYGLMFFHREKIAVGTKIGEYFSAGLPVIVNRNCLGAIGIIGADDDLGLVVDLGLGERDQQSPDLKSKHPHLREQPSKATRSKLSSFAVKYFDNRAIASTYCEIYNDLS